MKYICHLALKCEVLKLIYFIPRSFLHSIAPTEIWGVHLTFVSALKCGLFGEGEIYAPAPRRRVMGFLNRIFYVASHVVLTYISSSARKRKSNLFRFSRSTSLIKAARSNTMGGTNFCFLIQPPAILVVFAYGNNKPTVRWLLWFVGCQPSPN